MKSVEDGIRASPERYLEITGRAAAGGAGIADGFIER
jgi:hypothetical protein